MLKLNENCNIIACEWLKTVIDKCEFDTNSYFKLLFVVFLLLYYKMCFPYYEQMFHLCTEIEEIYQ